jgi:hypothetical protein
MMEGMRVEDRDGGQRMYCFNSQSNRAKLMNLGFKRASLVAKTLLMGGVS